MNRRSRYMSAIWIVAAALLTSRPNRCVAQSSSVVSVATLRVSDKAWKHFNRAKTAAQHERVAESERESFKAIELSPGFAEAYLLLAGEQMSEHKYDAALANIQSARGFDPSARWSGILMAGAYNGLGRYADAQALLMKMQGDDADSWQAAYERARAETGMANPQAALRWSAAALQAAPPHFADAHLVRANALLVARQWGEAIAQMNEYLNSPAPRIHRAEVLTAVDGATRHMHEEETGAEPQRAGTATSSSTSR